MWEGWVGREVKGGEGGRGRWREGSRWGQKRKWREKVNGHKHDDVIALDYVWGGVSSC